MQHENLPTFSDLDAHTVPTHEHHFLDDSHIFEAVAHLVPAITDLEIVNRQKSLLLAAFLAFHPNTTHVFLQAMHAQLPEWNDYPTDRRKWTHEEQSVYIFYRALLHALDSHTPPQITLRLDSFVQQVDKQHRGVRLNPRKLNPQPDLNLGDFFTSTRLSDLGRRKHATVERAVHWTANTDVQTALNGLWKRNPHLIADGMPRFPLNVYRGHDHRKMIIITNDDRKLAILGTFNFDSPTDHDCGLVITGPDIVHALEEWIFSSPVRHGTQEGDGWRIHQDSAAELNPEKPFASSVILGRLLELTADSDTHTIRQTSQFLPFKEQLTLIEEGLQSGRLKQVEFFAPHPSFWPKEYWLTGGFATKHMVERLTKQYPAFSITYTSKRYQHAKTALFEHDAGSTLVITSSNFVPALVKARTTEIALELEAAATNTLDSYFRFLAELRVDQLST